MDLHPTVRLAFTLALLPAFTTACGVDVSREAPPDTEVEMRAKSELDSLIRVYQEAYNAGDLETAISVFSDDAIYFPPAGAMISDRDSLRSYLARELEQSPSLRLSSQGTDPLTEALVVDHGRWEIRAAAEAGGKLRTLHGGYLMVARWTDDGWKILRWADTYDALPPMPMPEAMR